MVRASLPDSGLRNKALNLKVDLSGAGVLSMGMNTSKCKGGEGSEDRGR